MNKPLGVRILDLALGTTIIAVVVALVLIAAAFATQLW